VTHASVDTWDVLVSFPQGMLLDRRGKIAPLDSPLIHRRQTLSSTGPNGQQALRMWSLNLRNLTPDDYTKLIALIDSSAMGCEPIDITIRGFELAGGTSETVQVRILNERVNVRAESPVRFIVDIELEEFLHAP